LVLDAEETVAVAVGLSAAASGWVTGIEEAALRALAKLEQMVPAHLRTRIDALRSSVSFAGDGAPAINAATLTTVAAAAHNHELLRFDYRGRAGESSVRQVEPHTLVYSGFRWYLLAWDRDRDDWRTFRIDRIEPRMATHKRVAPRDAPEGGATAFVTRGVASTF
jgi:predicted DNA-binding transcriptional regulator YafY